jgi:hypothetical protein
MEMIKENNDKSVVNLRGKSQRPEFVQAPRNPIFQLQAMTYKTGFPKETQHFHCRFYRKTPKVVLVLG